LFLGHRASCKLLRHEHPRKPMWLKIMESRPVIALIVCMFIMVPLSSYAISQCPPSFEFVNFPGHEADKNQNGIICIKDLPKHQIIKDDFGWEIIYETRP